jgi:putative transcriptional regulator
MKLQNGNVAADIKEGLQQALRHAKGEVKYRTRTVDIAPVPNFKAYEIKHIRATTQLSQVMFALAIGVSPKTVEAWEAGTNEPAGPAQRILGFIAADQNCLEKWGVIAEKVKRK